MNDAVPATATLLVLMMLMGVLIFTVEGQRLPGSILIGSAGIMLAILSD